MRAMLLRAQREPLALVDVPPLQPAAGQVLLKISACGVCRTDLHVRDGDLPNPKLPLVLGHQAVGTVTALGEGVSTLLVGHRVGVPWLGYTCGQCPFCKSARENLCERALFTGYNRDGGYAEEMVADARYCFPLPTQSAPQDVAPLLCAGMIGSRALSMVEDAECVALYGFGAAAHIVIQIARWRGQTVIAFTRAGDHAAQRLATKLGAAWAGDTTQAPPLQPQGAIIFASAGELVPLALGHVQKGGTVVCAGIHMSDIPSFSYDLLWGERVLRSVANLTRQDGETLLRLAAEIPLRTRVRTYALEDANRALDDLHGGRVQGAAVLTV